jgi:sigma-B regulation protein RsbU (phosphoserine phosphatase)
MEIWGGNRKVAQRVELPGLAGWVYSTPLQPAAGGGDLHYLSACDQGVLARIAVADISGHGQAVSSLAEKLRGLMREHISTWDQSGFLRELNQAFQEGLTGVKFATVVVLGFFRDTGQLVFTNAGHLPPLWYHATEKSWDLLEDDTPHAETDITGLPLGLIPTTDYLQVAVRLAPNDVVVLYTDALSEAKNKAGQQLGQEGLLQRVKNLPITSPEAIGQGLLKAVEQYREGSAVGDDETLLVLQRVDA